MDNFDLRKYLAEGKLLKEDTIPSGWDEWTEKETLEFLNSPGETAIKIWDAPMEGWDEEHRDVIIIKQKDDGKHYLDGYVAFGDYKEQGPFDSYEEVFQLAVDEMNAFKEDWGDDLRENKLLKEEITLDFYDEDAVTLIDDSGEYDGDIEEDGMVSFSVVDEDVEDEYEDGFADWNWEDYLGPNHAFVEINKQIPTKVEASGDYVMITINIDDLKEISRLAENKLLKEDEQPTHRIKTDVYYIKDYEDGRPGGMEFQDEAVPAYEIADPEEDYFDSVMDDVLRYDDGNFLYIDEGEEGWYDGDYFETVGGSNTRLLPDYLELIKEPDQQGGYGYNL